jgi:hypothetical protein
MINLVALAFPQGLFDAATKVTSWWALGAFAIAAVVAILLGTSRKVKSAESRFPVAAVIVIIVAITVPVAGAVIVASFPDPPIRVTVTVEDATGAVVSDPHVTSSVGGQQSKTEGGVLIEIPPSNVPADGQITFWADKGNSRGKATKKFERARSIAVTVPLMETVQPKPPETAKASNVPDPPKPLTWCDQSPAGAPYQYTLDFYPHEHLNGKREGGDPVNVGAGWYVEWQAPGPVMVPVTFTHDGTHMEAFECGPVLGRETVAFCHGWKNGGNFMGHMSVRWKQPCP